MKKRPTTLSQLIEFRSGMSVSEFLNPDPEPYLYGLEESVTFFKQETMGTIYIFADYDCDGIASGTILYLSICEYLKGSSRQVIVRFPRRFSEGYGISEKAVDEIPDGSILLTVDNGITAVTPIRKAKEKGTKVIILDHHLAGEELPDADWIVDPHTETRSAFQDYCGAGLAYRFAKELLPKGHPLLDKLLVLAGIATVADMVPLLGANRYLVQKSLEYINAGVGTDGLRALLRTLNIRHITEETYGFLIGPICNASGRILDDGAKDVFALLSSELDRFALDYDQQFLHLHEQANILITRNEKRKEMTKDAFEAVRESMGLHEWVKHYPVLVVRYGSVDTLGIIGLVAGQLAKEYQRPVFVFSETAIPGVLSGSARSYGEVHLKKELLDPCMDLFLSAGGHAAAAGVRIREEDLEIFRKRMDSLISVPDKQETSYDLEISEKEISSCYQEEQRFAPFGVGNEKPVYLIQDYSLSPAHGKFYEAKGERDIKLYHPACNAYGYGMLQKYLDLGEPKCLHLIGSFRTYEFRGKEIQSLEIFDLSSAEPVVEFSDLQKSFFNLLDFTKEV